MTPDPALSPNARVHWGKKHAAAKSQRAAGRTAARSSVFHPSLTTATTIWVAYDVHWSGRRRRMDDDNLIAALKPIRDGIAETLKGDDAQWITLRVTQTTGNTNGTIVVHLAAGDSPSPT